MVQLTDKMIEVAFGELAIDGKYFDKFKEEVERCYSELQRGCPEDDDDPEEESNADASIRLSKEFMEYYVPEKEKGHCEAWAEAYARSNLPGMEEYSSYRNAYYALEEEVREKELDIHVASMSDDPLFRKRYKYLFTEIIGDPKEAAENYCNDYRRMIALGKSDIYAHAYADYHDEYKEKFCVIYAQAYELAKEHGMDDREAYCFGDTCTDAVDQGLWPHKYQFLKSYQEDWQKEFYFNLMKQDFEETEHRKMSSAEENEFREDLFGFKKDIIISTIE